MAQIPEPNYKVRWNGEIQMPVFDDSFKYAEWSKIIREYEAKYRMPIVFKREVKETFVGIDLAKEEPSTPLVFDADKIYPQ
jgi:hypothetical protein